MPLISCLGKQPVADCLLRLIQPPLSTYAILRRLPIVLTWATKAKIELKQLLIPLSFAALLGALWSCPPSICRACRHTGWTALAHAFVHLHSI